MTRNKRLSWPSLPFQNSNPLSMLRRTKSKNNSDPPSTPPVTANAPLSNSSRSNSWTTLSSLVRRKSGDQIRPESPVQDDTSLDQVTLPKSSSTASITRPARLFRPGSSSSTSSSSTSTRNQLKPLTPFPSVHAQTQQVIVEGIMSSKSAGLSQDQLDLHAQQLILNAIDRTRSVNSSTTNVGRQRTDSDVSDDSRGAPTITPSNSDLPSAITNPNISTPTYPLQPSISGPTVKSPSSWLPSALSWKRSSLGGTPTGMNTPPYSSSATNLQSRSMSGIPEGEIAPFQRGTGAGVPLTKTLTTDSTATDDGRLGRGRSMLRDRARSASPLRIFKSSSNKKDKEPTKPDKRNKSHGHNRSQSPHIGALQMSQSDVESDAESLGGARVRPSGLKRRVGRRTAFWDSSASTKSGDSEEEEDEESEWSEDENECDDGFDLQTTSNTEANATLPLDPSISDAQSFKGYDDDIELPDPFGEGVNVVRPEEPMFARSLMLREARPKSTSTNTNPTQSTPATVAGRTPKRKKTGRSILNTHDPLPLHTSRPAFARDRCTVVITHGDPKNQGVAQGDGASVFSSEVEKRVRDPKVYVVLSDLSEESKWACEWGIGTVLRDGDEMILITVQETDTKMDPSEGSSVDRMQKIRNQQERQALAMILVREATSLLQRTRLNVTVTCQALHAKNARRLFLDLIDLIDPTMVIVGSRGLGKLKGILLGSTSHYLIQKSSVPVMVARRRLKKHIRKSHTAAQAVALRSEKKVSLADARIEKMSSGQGMGATGVNVEEIMKEHERAERQWPQTPVEGDDPPDEDDDDEVVESPVEGKVAGTT